MRRWHNPLSHKLFWCKQPLHETSTALTHSKKIKILTSLRLLSSCCHVGRHVFPERTPCRVSMLGSTGKRKKQEGKHTNSNSGGTQECWHRLPLLNCIFLLLFFCHLICWKAKLWPQIIHLFSNVLKEEIDFWCLMQMVKKKQLVWN